MVRNSTIYILSFVEKLYFLRLSDRSVAVSGRGVVGVQFAIRRTYNLYRTVTVSWRQVAQRTLLRSFRPCICFTSRLQRIQL